MMATALNNGYLNNKDNS